MLCLLRAEDLGLAGEAMSRSTRVLPFVGLFTLWWDLPQASVRGHVIPMTVCFQRRQYGFAPTVSISPRSCRTSHSLGCIASPSLAC